MTSARYALMTSSRRIQASARASSLAGEEGLLWRRIRDVSQPLSITRACSLTSVNVDRMCEISHSVTPRVRARRVQSPSTDAAMSVRRTNGGGDARDAGSRSLPLPTASSATNQLT